MHVSSLAFAAVVACLAIAASAAEPARPFVDITAESGVDAVVDAGYAASAKWWLSGIDLVDLDGDGKLDLFLSSHGGGPAMAALGDGKGHFLQIKQAALPPTEIHVGYDIDEDGLLDLQMTFQDGGGKWWLNRSTPGHVDFTATKIDLGGAQARQNAMIDIDRDGKVDWLHESGVGDVTFDKGDGKGTFTPTKKVLLSTKWKDGPSMIPVDLNGDGFIDLIMSMRGYEEEKTGRSRIFLNDARKDGTVGFTESTKACGLSEEGLQILGVGEFNADGATDLICLEGGKTVTVYLNDGKGKFTKLEGAISGMQAAGRPVDANWGLAVTVDIDNDGIPDVLMNGREFLYVLRGTGGGHFVYMNKVWGIDDEAKAAVDAGICFGDIDNDGRLDLLGYKAQPKWNDPARVKVYHNELPAQNWLRIRPIGAACNKSAAGAKIRIYEPGGLGDAKKLIAYEQVCIFGRQVVHSYYSYAQTERHFGLAGRQSVDVSVEFYPSGKVVSARGVKANSTTTISE